MKIVLTIHHFPPNFFSGAEIYTYRLARWLVEKGYEVNVVCVESITYGNGNEIKHTHEIYQDIPVWRLYFNIGQAQNPFRQSYNNLMVEKWFLDFLRHKSPNIVHINSCYLLSANIIKVAKQLSLPVILTLHDFWFVCPRITLLKPTGSLCTIPENPVKCVWCLATEKRRFRLPEKMSFGGIGIVANVLLSLTVIEKMIGIFPDTAEIVMRRKTLMDALNQVDLIISPSKFLRNIFIRQGINSSKILYSRIGLDINYWDTPTASDKIQLENLRIGYIGQLAPHKGLHLLIKAFNRLSFNRRQANLKIYGNLNSFPSYTKLLRKFAKNNPKIEFLGSFKNQKVAKILQNIDIIVTPSTWYENSPITIMESLSTGTPVVTSNLGGMSEMVQHNVNGLLFKMGNVYDLSKQLQLLIDNPELVDRLTKQARPVRMIDDEMKYITSIYNRVSYNIT